MSAARARKVVDVPHQVWRGSIVFGLVNVAVKAFPAVRDHKVRFHQIDRATGSRVGYEKVSKSTGEPVAKEDIDLGYELDSGEYVTFRKEEVDALRPSSTRSVEIAEFVDLAAIDPVFYERTYWLSPADDTAARAYRLLTAAMESEQRVGIGRVVMRNTEYLAAIRPLDGALAMSTMRFADEVLDRDEVLDLPEASEPEERELKLAVQIVESLTTEWDPAAHHDQFNEELRSMIEEKARGRDVVSVAEGEPAPEGRVVDLMQALEQSVEEAKKPSKKGKKSA
jgi:DNA end-binding protein Ku